MSFTRKVHATRSRMGTPWHQAVCTRAVERRLLPVLGGKKYTPLGCSGRLESRVSRGAVGLPLEGQVAGRLGHTYMCVRFHTHRS